MLGGRSWDEWIAQYSGSHQHPVNRREERAHRASASGSSTRMGVDSGNTGPPPATSTSAKQATNRRPRAGRGARKPSPSRFASTLVQRASRKSRDGAVAVQMTFDYCVLVLQGRLVEVDAQSTEPDPREISMGVLRRRIAWHDEAHDYFVDVVTEAGLPAYLDLLDQEFKEIGRRVGERVGALERAAQAEAKKRPSSRRTKTTPGPDRRGCHRTTRQIALPRTGGPGVGGSILSGSYDGADPQKRSGRRRDWTKCAPILPGAPGDFPHPLGRASVARLSRRRARLSLVRPPGRARLHNREEGREGDAGASRLPTTGPPIARRPEHCRRRRRPLAG
jgi:hypothetical protein